MLYTACLLAILISSPIVFAALLFLPAPYGRYASTSWGPTAAARTAWLVMELPALCVIPLVFLRFGGSAPPAVALLCLWEMHYVYRTLAFPFLIRDTGRRMPVLLVLMAMVFNAMNGYVNGAALSVTPPRLGADALTDSRFALGIAVFALGFAVHVLADSGLRRLRAPGETGYRIPRGGLFDLVACPNYFGEIVQWCGWALAAWSPAAAAFAVFTAANLVPRAHVYRRWYRERFPDYPMKRKRVIPFLF
jgi:protein-S-isoprenylcysteine O-methyltransferase Ste14